MRSRIVKFSGLLLCLSLSGAFLPLIAGKKDKLPAGADDQKRAVHALNRLAFGPRPGDVERVMTMGVDHWIDLQLRPEKISDGAIEAPLAPLRTLRMSAKELVEDFPDAQVIRAVKEGKRPMPSDPARRAIYQVQIARLEERQAKREQAKAEPAQVASESMAKQGTEPSAATNADSSAAEGGAKTEAELAAAAAASPDAQPASTSESPGRNPMAPENANTSGNEMATASEPKAATPEEDAEAQRREDRLYTDLKIQSLIDLPPDQRYKKILSMSVDEQVAFADSLRGGKGQDFLAGMDPKQKETLIAMNAPQMVVVEELAQAKLLRAIYSERQLEEVMTDFWFNHFNVFVGKGPERLLLTSYEQQVIRPHAMGKFEDLLVATAKSPAMLFYLDNWLSVGPNSMQALGIPARPVRYGPYGRPRFPRPNPNARRKNSGLNENYGRELLELHTLSVNGGYSQRDVTEVAKVFTGWTIDKPANGGEFHFEPRMHEPGPKFVLGHRIKPKGEDEGKEVLHMLATSPQTAHFVSLKLAQRFVSDDPPPALVDRMAKTFEKKKGDIREVLSTLFHSPEFWADSAYRAKVKTPLEFVASAVRATGADVQDALPLARQLQKMGMPLYGSQPPTGYSTKNDAWVSSSALLNRMNFALALTSGKVRGVKVDAAGLTGDAPPDGTIPAMETKLLAAEVSKQTHDSIVSQVNAAKSSDPNAIAGLLIGSPEFQRR